MFGVRYLVGFKTDLTGVGVYRLDKTSINNNESEADNRFTQMFTPVWDKNLVENGEVLSRDFLLFVSGGKRILVASTKMTRESPRKTQCDLPGTVFLEDITFFVLDLENGKPDGGLMDAMEIGWNLFDDDQLVQILPQQPEEEKTKKVARLKRKRNARTAFGEEESPGMTTGTETEANPRPILRRRLRVEVTTLDGSDPVSYILHHNNVSMTPFCPLALALLYQLINCSY
ncbi:hypothetical protein AX774_g2621 [Zancudomyces culisetae]|uniref:Uncharacterized protein n=1 Tax=Zancudomyces culisetae TaxID=1213189 RepID=A0A1R1PSA0_ZANCU|nr:hypothetical protein AX774_g2621 [Zancudomyces culisetae]|eukprot:OMH83866.1 hypothetical protein AX774_g2621 [Zancudomyces culisetae]